MWDLKDLEELEIESRRAIIAEINQREETEFYERACTLFYMAVSCLFGGVTTVFILAASHHLK